MNYSALAQAAIHAAYLAGRILKERFYKAHTIKQKEGIQNLVTESDLLAEEEILSFLKERFPSHGFLSEERESSNLGAETIWIIDPLDGTVNYARNIPHFSVSIAAYQDYAIIAGVIFHPMTGELFVAEKGKGAFLQNTPISVSKGKNLSSSLLASGFPYNVHQNPMNCIEVFSHFLQGGTPIRRLGSAALDLAYTAAGRFDAYWETTLQPWDVAAGILLVEEAGGVISTWEGKKHPILTPSAILAAGPDLHPIMLQNIQQGKSSCKSSTAS
jgi:myo-inositol-1(or 4)-monophosphatase